MADYYTLIARAISGLEPSATGERRRALYERARVAPIAQLRGARPELSESQITRERLSLEDAVRKVESEAAQRARSARKTYANVPSPPGSAPSASSPRPRPPHGQEPERQDPRQQPNPRADAPPKRFAESFRSRDALAAQAKRQAEAAQAKADKERRETEERIENERQELIQQLRETERATREQDETRRQRDEQEAARIQNAQTLSTMRLKIAMICRRCLFANARLSRRS